MKNLNNDDIREVVRGKYAKVAGAGVNSCACAPTSSTGCCSSKVVPSPQMISKALGYSEEELTAVPEGANMGLGCGNPQAIASLQPGETVLDLGSGGGFDAFLAAKAVGRTGRVIGVDMTAEMVSKARNNAFKAGVDNVEFRLGEIENLPVADHSVDVIISNCVINLSPEKEKVFYEAFRVLKPGGRLGISDIVTKTQLPGEIKENLAFYAGCVAGASSKDELTAILERVGFGKIHININEESRKFIRGWIPELEIDNYIASATIEAIKPTK